MASARVAAGWQSIPATSRASAAPSAGTIARRTPRLASATSIGSSPGTYRTSPPSDSSPTRPHRTRAACTCSDPRRIPMAIPRSSDEPALRRSAGARLTVMRRGGNAKPLLRIAPRTRSRASRSAASASPTMENPGRPGATSTSTRMTRPSRPWTVAESTVASMPPRYAGALTSHSSGTAPPLTRRGTAATCRRNPGPDFWWPSNPLRTAGFPGSRDVGSPENGCPEPCLLIGVTHDHAHR